MNRKYIPRGVVEIGYLNSDVDVIHHQFGAKWEVSKEYLEEYQLEVGFYRRRLLPYFIDIAPISLRKWSVFLELYKSDLSSIQGEKSLYYWEEVLSQNLDLDKIVRGVTFYEAQLYCASMGGYVPSWEQLARACRGPSV